MSRIRIVRNSAGNCINFVGTDNPTYWNACLRGEVNADDATRVNVVNTVQSYGSDTAYAFYAIPYYRFCDADGNDFANAQECADYITAQANVSGATAGYELTDQDQLGFRRDPTDTTIIISDGEYYPVNILLAEDAGDGTITIREQGDNGNILYTGLRPANASINGVAVNPVLADAVNELNALFNVESIITPGVTTIINNYYYLGDDTIDPFGPGNERNPPMFTVPDLNSDGNDNNNGFTTDATGDYFIWAGPASNDPNNPYNKGNYLVGIVPADQDVTDFDTHTDLTQDLTWWVEVTDQGYTQNAGTILNPNTLTSGVAYGSGSSVAKQFRIGRDTDNRLIVEGTTVPWGTTPIETDWFEIIRTNTTVAAGSKWRFVWKAMSDGACINTNTIIAVDGENSLTYYYIESPDTVFYYPIFTTASEAAYYSANPDLGGGDGTYTSVTFDDVPGNIVYYIPNNGSTIDGTLPATQGPLHPNTGNGYDVNGTYWTEIPTEADNLYVPIAFNGSNYIFNEGDGVNIVIQTDGAYTTTVTGLPNGLTYENGNITGSAPEVPGTILDNQYDTFIITVTRTNSYGSSTGTFVIQVNNQTAPPTAITGWTWDPDTEQLINEETLNEGSVVCIDNPLSEDYRMIFSRTWINTNVLPYLQEAGDAIYIGVVRSGMSITDYTDPANVDDLDWEAYISFEYVSPTSHRSTLYGYHNGAPQKNQVLSASLTATTYDFAFENDDHSDLYVLAANVKSLNNEAGLDYGGSVARSVETFADGDLEICMATVGCNATIENTGVDMIRIPLGDKFIRINEPTDEPETYTFDTATATGLPDMPTLQAGQTYTFFMGSNDLTGLDNDDILCFTLDGTTEYTAVARAVIVGTEINPVITGGNQNILINGRNITLLDTGPNATINDLIEQINLALEISPAINVIASNNGTGQLRLRATDDTTNIAVANNGGTGLEQLGITATTVTPTSGLIRNGVPGEAGTTVTFVVPIDVPVPLYWHIGSKNDMNVTTVEEVIVTGSIWPDDLVTDPADSSTPVVDPTDPDENYLFPDPVTGLTAGGGLQNGTAIELGLLQRGQRMVFSHDFIRHLTEHMPLYETGGTDVLRDKNRIYIGIIAAEAYETNIYGTGAMLETRLSTPRYPDAGATGWGTENAGMGSAIFGNSAMWFEKSTYNYADHSQTASYDPLTQGTHQARGFFTTAMNLGRISADPGTEDIYDEWAYAIEFSPASGDDNLYYLADPDENLLYTLPGDHTNHQEWSMYDGQRMADVLGGGSTSSTQLSVPADWRRYFSQTEEDNGNDPWLVADPSTTPATYGYRVVLIAEGPNGSFADIELDLNGIDIIPIPVENPIAQTSTHAWDGKGSNFWVKDNSPYAQGGITLAEHASNVFYDASTSTTTPSAPNSAGATSPDGYPWAFASVFQMDIPTPTTKQTLFTVGSDPLTEHGVFSIMFDGHYLQLLMGAGNEIYISEKPDFYFRHGDWYGLYIDYNGEHIMSGVNTSFRIHNVNLSTGNSHSIELDFNEFRKATWDDVPNNRPSGDISTNITYTGQGLEGNQCVGVYPVQTLSTDSMTRTNYWLGNIAQITQTTLPVNSVLPTDHEIALMTRDPITWIAEYKETGSLNNSAGTYRLPANNTNSTGFVSGTGGDGYQGVQVYRFGDGLPDGETFSSYQIPNEIYSNQENTPTRLGGNGNTTGCIINVTVPGITVDPGVGGGGDGTGGTGGTSDPYGEDGLKYIGGMVPDETGYVAQHLQDWPSDYKDDDYRQWSWYCIGDQIKPGERMIFTQDFMYEFAKAMDYKNHVTFRWGLLANRTAGIGPATNAFYEERFGKSILDEGASGYYKDWDSPLQTTTRDGVEYTISWRGWIYEPAGWWYYSGTGPNDKYAPDLYPTGFLGDTFIQSDVELPSNGSRMFFRPKLWKDGNESAGQLDWPDGNTHPGTIGVKQNANGALLKHYECPVGYIELSKDGTRIRWALAESWRYTSGPNQWDPETENWLEHGFAVVAMDPDYNNERFVRWETVLPEPITCADLGLHVQGNSYNIFGATDGRGTNPDMYKMLYTITSPTAPLPVPPPKFSNTSLTVDENTIVDYEIDPADADWTTVISGQPEGWILNSSGHLVGTAPEVTDDNVTNPISEYTISVTRTKVYTDPELAYPEASSTGYIFLDVTNLDVPPVPIAGYTHVSSSDTLAAPNTLRSGSVVSLDNTIEDGSRIVFSPDWIENNIFANHSGSGSGEYAIIGIPYQYADLSGISPWDFRSGLKFYRTGNTRYVSMINNHYVSSTGNYGTRYNRDAIFVHDFTYYGYFWSVGWLGAGFGTSPTGTMTPLGADAGRTQAELSTAPETLVIAAANMQVTLDAGGTITKVINPR